jgi:sarcosine oxidase
MGSATARELARAGRRVVLLEQFYVGHTRGSSHGASRIFRFSYPDPMYVSMAQEALPLWRALESESGESLLTTTGGLDTGKALADHAAALDACGARFELVDGATITKRIPVVKLGRDEPALYQPDAGVIAADRAVAAFVRSAAAAGAEVNEGVTVVDMQPSGNHVEVGTSDGAVRARKVVVTAGAWAARLLAGAGIDLALRPTRETVGYFRLDAVPPTFVDWGDPAVYALASPGEGLKVGEHRAGPTVDPNAKGSPDDESLERLRAWVGERYPRADPAPRRAETCLYTNTIDNHFILERHGSIVVGSPCSGHGFKFAPLIGKRLAWLALED